MDDTSIEGRARIVAYARLALADLEAEYDRHKLAFTAQHSLLIQKIAASKQALADGESNLRQAAIRIYRQTLNRKPVPGVSVVVTTTATIEDKTLVGEWCLAHCREALVIDDKMVKAIARASRVIPGIKVELVPHAQISESLSTILGIEGAIAHEQQGTEGNAAGDSRRPTDRED